MHATHAAEPKACFPALYRTALQARQAKEAARRPLPPAPRRSGKKLVRLAPAQVAMFRFLLEAYENLAYFTVLERHTALLKLVYAPAAEHNLMQALAQMQESLPFSVEDWPLPL